MKDYQLKEDEVVLFKGDIELQGVKGKTELIFTNHNFVFITKHKKVFAKEETYVQIYPVSDVKIYEKKPQIRVKDLNVEIYFLSTEKVCTFASVEDKQEFVGAVNKHLTKKSIAEKGAKKVKDGISLFNDTFGVDIVHSTGELINNVATTLTACATGAVGDAIQGVIRENANEAKKGILKLGKKVFSKNKKPQG
ncbi:MAG: hypothetical protein J6K71_01755 [Clostridia bacterium]|nr:hypothetical protein [Clostridia bacterium]